MLKYWIDETTPYKGVHVYEVNRQKAYISTSLGGKPFSFAITNFMSTQQAVFALSDWKNGFLALRGHSHDWM